MTTPFKKLLQRYHSNRTTDKERFELMEMIRSGKYDAEVGSNWVNMLEENLSSPLSGKLESDAEIRAIRDRIALKVETKPGNTKRFKLVTALGWSTAAAVGILLIIAVFWKREVKQDVHLITEVEPTTTNDRVYSGKQFVKLPDGSSVILNERSELRYTHSFGLQTREVYLSGEAFFDITPDPDIPFLVRTGKINTRVLGTAFNVEAWPNESRVNVTVARGKVSVGDDEHVFEELVPNEQLSINTETEVYKKTKLDVEEATEWKQSFFVLDKVKMENAARRISERYGVNVIIENENLRNCLINGAFLENESVEHVISVISLAMNADYRFEGDKIRINGGIGCE